MKLYYHPKTRSMRPHIMLEELGVECERVFVDFDAGEHKSEKYLAVHPLGQLPALDDGGVVAAPAVVEDLHARTLLSGLPDVLGNLEVAQGGAVAALLFGLAQVHVSNDTDSPA